MTELNSNAVLIQLQPGSIFDDRYEIIELMDEGGMGSVYKARELELNRLVAVKLLQSSLMTDHEYYTRFRQEGEVLSRLNHPGIVDFYRFGLWQSKLAYIVMEFLEGRSLRRELDICGVLPSLRCAEIGIQACQAMQVAHREDVVHRDLKPDNIFLQKDGDNEFVKIIDFGLARANVSSGSNQHLTQTGMLVGSVYYMSPEQCTGRPADSRSDIYSLACVLYEALSGKPPFDAENPIGLMSLHVNSSVPSVARSNPEVTDAAAWDTVLQKALSKEPRDRYASMSDFGADLVLIRNGNWSSDRNVALIDKQSPVRKRSWAIILAGAVAVILCVVAVVGGLDRITSEKIAQVQKSRIVPLTADRISKDWIIDYRLHRENIPRDKCLSSLKLWLSKYGDSDERGAAFANTWICLELMDRAADVTFSTAKHTPLYSFPPGGICTKEAAKQRDLALALFVPLLADKSLDAVDRSVLTYYQMLLQSLDKNQTKRAEIYRSILAKNDEIGERFSNELRGALADIYRSAGAYLDEEKIIKPMLGTSTNISLRTAESWIHQGRMAEAKTRITNEAADLFGSRWTQFGKRNCHYLSQLLLFLDMPEKALRACDSCEIDTDQTDKNRLFDNSARVCLCVSDHAYISALSLERLGKRTEAIARLKNVNLKDYAIRSRLMVPVLQLEQLLGLSPEAVLNRLLSPQGRLHPHDILWMIQAKAELANTYPDLSTRLRDGIVTLSAGSIQHQPLNYGIPAAAIQMLIKDRDLIDARRLLELQEANLEPGEFTNRSVCASLLRAEFLSAEGKKEEAVNALNHIIQQFKSADSRYSRAYLVSALSERAELLAADDKLSSAMSDMKEAAKISEESYDITVAQKIRLWRQYSELCKKTDPLEYRKASREYKRLLEQDSALLNVLLQT